MTTPTPSTLLEASVALPELTDDELFTVWDEHYENLLSYNRPSLDRAFMRAVIKADREANVRAELARSARAVPDKPMASEAFVNEWNSGFTDWSVTLGKAWQPIATAPKDGDRLLYLAIIGDNGLLQSIDHDALWGEVGERLDGHEIYSGYAWLSANGMEEPTHWAYQDGAPPGVKAKSPTPNSLAIECLEDSGCWRHRGGDPETGDSGELEWESAASVASPATALPAVTPQVADEGRESASEWKSRVLLEACSKWSGAQKIEAGDIIEWLADFRINVTHPLMAAVPAQTGEVARESLIARLKAFRGPYLGDGVNTGIHRDELIAALAHSPTVASPALVAEVGGLELDAKRYRWLADRFLGADFDWGGDEDTGQRGCQALVFTWPGGKVWSDLAMTLDAALAASPVVIAGEKP